MIIDLQNGSKLSFFKDLFEEAESANKDAHAKLEHLCLHSQPLRINP